MEVMYNNYGNYNMQGRFSLVSANPMDSSVYQAEDKRIIEDPRNKDKEDKATFTEDAYSVEISSRGREAYDASQVEIPSEAVKKQIEEAIEAAKERAEEMEDFRVGLSKDDDDAEVSSPFAGYSIAQMKDMYFDGRISYKTFAKEVANKEQLREEAKMDFEPQDDVEAAVS